MSAIAHELDETLATLDAQSAAALERLVRDALDLAVGWKPGKTTASRNANGWPEGHFELYAGSLAGEDWEPPADPPPGPSE